VAVQKRREETSIHESWYGNVMRGGCKASNNFFALKVTLQLVTLRVVPAAAEAVRKVVGVEILDRWIHCFILVE
jgi:hypothetical protein